MSIHVDYLPEATVIVAVALLVITLAIAVLRRLRTLLIVGAAVIVVGWGVVLYPKYKDQIRSKDFPRIRLEYPTESPAPAIQHDVEKSKLRSFKSRQPD